MYIFYLKSHFNGPKKVRDEQDWLQFEFPQKIHFLVGHDFLCTLSSSHTQCAVTWWDHLSEFVFTVLIITPELVFIRPDRSPPVHYAETSMKNGFGLKYIHKFLNLPFLLLQVSYCSLIL